MVQVFEETKDRKCKLELGQNPKYVHIKSRIDFGRRLLLGWRNIGYRDAWIVIAGIFDVEHFEQIARIFLGDIRRWWLLRLLNRLFNAD